MAETTTGHGAGAAAAGLTWQILKSVFPLALSLRRQCWDDVLSELDIDEARRGEDSLFYGALLARIREDIRFVVRLDREISKSGKKKDRDRTFQPRGLRWLETRIPEDQDVSANFVHWPGDLFPEHSAEREMHDLLLDYYEHLSLDDRGREDELEDFWREAKAILQDSLELIDCPFPDDLPEAIIAARAFADAADAYLTDIISSERRRDDLQETLKPLAGDAEAAPLIERLAELSAPALYACAKLVSRYADDLDAYVGARASLTEEEQRFDRLRDAGKPWSTLSESAGKIAALEMQRDEARGALSELLERLAVAQGPRRRSRSAAAAAAAAPATAEPRRQTAGSARDAGAGLAPPGDRRPANSGQRPADAGAAAGGADLPMSWAEFPDWCATHLKDSLVLSSAALKAIKKARYKDVANAAFCMRWLAGDYRRGRMDGAGDELQGSIGPGLWNERCGSDAFDYLWDGESMRVDWHIKNGGNTRDPLRCLRIYYSWDEARQRVVIAEMPAHRRSAGT